MDDQPIPGEEIEMPFVSGDARIEVANVPEHQPLENQFGIIFVIDQYGDEHLVEKDADTWVTCVVSALSDEAYEIYEQRATAAVFNKH